MGKIHTFAKLVCAHTLEEIEFFYIIVNRNMANSAKQPSEAKEYMAPSFRLSCLEWESSFLASNSSTHEDISDLDEFNPADWD